MRAELSNTARSARSFMPRNTRTHAGCWLRCRERCEGNGCARSTEQCQFLARFRLAAPFIRAVRTGSTHARGHRRPNTRSATSTAHAAICTTVASHKSQVTSQPPRPQPPAPRPVMTPLGFGDVRCPSTLLGTAMSVVEGPLTIVICFGKCSSGREPVLWSVRRADRW
jgi:hypothetical protein